MWFSRRFLLMLGALTVLTAAAENTIKAVYPVNGQQASMLTPSQKLYALQTEEQIRRIFLEEKDLVDSLTKETGGQPQGIILRWRFSGDRPNIHYEVRYADNPELKGAITAQPPHSAYAIYNLELGKTYYWQASACHKDGSRVDTEIASFVVDPLPLRLLNVPNVNNFRDLGGKPAMAGRTSRQGLIFRSTGLNNNSSDGGKTPGKARFTEEGRRIMLEDLKLKTELDLRSHGETAGMTSSPLGDSINYINISSTCYSGLYTSDGNTNYAKLFRIFCDKNNYPINFHCIAGADRTGTLGFLLGATLGYSVKDLLVDYTYTSFCVALRPPAYFDQFYKPLLAYGKPDASLHVKAEIFLFQIGIQPEEIQAFRDIMLGPGTSLSPELQQYASLIKSFRDAPAAGQGLRLCGLRNRLTSTRFCGKNHDLTRYQTMPLDFLAASDGNGGFRFFSRPSNATSYAPLTFDVDVASLTAASYWVTSPSEKAIYTHDGNAIWTPQDLKTFCLPLPSPIWILQVSAQEPDTTGWEKVNAVTPFDAPYLQATPAAQPPVLDGNLDEPLWKTAVFHPLVHADDSDDATDHAARAVAVAMDSGASILYIAAKLEDRTLQPVGTKLDDPVWNGDSLELFLSSIDSDVYYQFVVNADGALYDGKGEDDKWNSEQVVARGRRTEDGWTVEIAIPLAQFNFQTPLELNIAGSDYHNNDNPTLFNLWPTQARFHRRSAMHPVVLDTK